MGLFVAVRGVNVTVTQGVKVRVTGEAWEKRGCNCQRVVGFFVTGDHSCDCVTSHLRTHQQGFRVIRTCVFLHSDPI